MWDIRFMKPKGQHPSNKLTVLMVKRESNRGSYADGNGLYLKVNSSGSKQWVQRLVINGKRTDMGLGSASLVSLTDARAIALKNRILAREGGVTLTEKRMKMELPTFKKASYSVYDLNKPTWKNEKHSKQWINILETYVFPFFGNKKLDKINSADVMNALMPIWTEKPETARRVKQRIGMVLKWSIAQGWRTDNPASTIDTALPKRDKTAVNHHKSLPYDEVAHAITTIQNTNALPISKLAFEFLVLNASRSGEVRGAIWDEIKGDKWEIPKERMKAKKAHRIPLSKRSMELLSIAETMKDGSGLIFPNNGKPLSDVAISKLLRENLIQAVPHGFRSSFRQWAAEKTNHPRQVCEFALAHVIGDKAEEAYQRSDLFEKRRNLMESWSQFVTNETADVIPMIQKKL